MPCSGAGEWTPHGVEWLSAGEPMVPPRAPSFQDLELQVAIDEIVLLKAAQPFADLAGAD